MIARIAFALLIATAVVAEIEKDGDVLVLTDATIDQAIKENEFLLVEFYAPWCGHCKSLEPEYTKAATVLANLETPIPIAKVDATENSEAAGKFGVRGYPTIKWFVNGKDSEYTGGRTESEIVKWIEKKTGPACKELASADDVTSFKDSADVVVVGFVAKDSEDFAVLESAARQIDEITVGVVFDDAAAAAFEVKAPAVVVFKNFDEGKAVFADKFDADEIVEFVSGNSLPLVATFSQETAPKLFGSGIESHFLYFNDAEEETHSANMEQLRKVAADYKGKTLFVHVPASEDRVMGYFDLSKDDLPAATLVALGEGDMKKFAFKGELLAEGIEAHVKAFHAGELKPTLKSEEIPEDNSGPVTVIVGKNFEEIVMDSTKDVLLEFYAPWCGHCKSLTPTYEELGAKFAGNSNVVIAKVDATANDIDHPAVNVKGFPTILFFAANAKDAPKTYEGGRDLDSFVAYIEENATVDLTAAAAAGHSEL